MFEESKIKQNYIRLEDGTKHLGICKTRTLTRLLLVGLLRVLLLRGIGRLVA